MSALLKNVYLFKDLDQKELAAVSEICKSQSLNSGDSLFIKGEPAQALFLIKFGSIKIQQTTKSGDSLVVSTLGTGSHFGEMPFIDGEVRSASAMAAEPTEIISIPYDKLRAYLNQNRDASVKIYRSIAHFLCGRLRATTTDLNFAREKNLTHF